MNKRSVLILEDNGLIALELRGVVSRAGFEVLGPVATVDAGMALARQRRPDAAVLDVHVRGGDCRPLAALLHSMAVPFVLATGYDEISEIEGACGHLRKPVPTPLLLSTLRELLPPDD